MIEQLIHGIIFNRNTLGHFSTEGLRVEFGLPQFGDDGVYLCWYADDKGACWASNWFLDGYELQSWQGRKEQSQKPVFEECSPKSHVRNKTFLPLHVPQDFVTSKDLLFIQLIEQKLDVRGIIRCHPRSWLQSQFINERRVIVPLLDYC